MSTITANETTTKRKLKEVKMWQVKLLNDDYTPFDFVVLVLTDMYYKSVDQAEAIALDIHRKGAGQAGGPYTREVAEQKANDTIRVARSHGHPLKARAEEM